MVMACENPWISSIMPARVSGGGQTFTVTVETYFYNGSSSTASARLGAMAGSEIQAVPGTMVRIEANASAGHRFLGWYVVYGDIELDNNGSSFVEFEKQPSNVKFRAYFEALPPGTPHLRLEPQLVDFGAAYSQPEAKTVTIRNIGTGAAAVSNISLDSDASFVLGGEGFITGIAADGTATFTVGTIQGLSPGTHGAIITVTYDNGETATANVVFELLPIVIATFNVTMQSDGNGTTSANQYGIRQGETVTITAAANSGHRFVQWQVAEGGVTLSTTTASTATFTMPDSDVTILAVFEALPPDTPYLRLEPQLVDFGAHYSRPDAVTLTIENRGTGVAVISNISLDSTASFVLDGEGLITSIAADATASFTVRPIEGLDFGTHNAVITVVYDGGTVTANAVFVLMPRTITMEIQGNGTASANPHEARQGDTIEIAAIPADANHSFVRWEVITGGVTLSDATANPATFTMPGSNVTIRAVFEPHDGELTLTFEFDPITAGASLTVPANYEVVLGNPDSGFTLRIDGSFESVVWTFRGNEELHRNSNTFVVLPEMFHTTDIGTNNISVLAIRNVNGTLIPYGTTIRFEVR